MKLYDPPELPQRILNRDKMTPPIASNPDDKDIDFQVGTSQIQDKQIKDTKTTKETDTDTTEPPTKDWDEGLYDIAARPNKNRRRLSQHLPDQRLRDKIFMSEPTGNQHNLQERYERPNTERKMVEDEGGGSLRL